MSQNFAFVIQNHVSVAYLFHANTKPQRHVSFLKNLCCVGLSLCRKCTEHGVAPIHQENMGLACEPITKLLRPGVDYAPKRSRHLRPSWTGSHDDKVEGPLCEDRRVTVGSRGGR